jgi:hypothetical protein
MLGRKIRLVSVFFGWDGNVAENLRVVLSLRKKWKDFVMHDVDAASYSA